MPAPRSKRTAEEDGVELAEMSLRNNEDHDGYDGQWEEEGQEGNEGQGDEEGDRLPLLAEQGSTRADRRARRAQNRAAEVALLRQQLRLLWKTFCGLLALGTVLSAAATLIATIELRRHFGRLFFALPLTWHLLIDSLVALAPLLCALGDGENEPPPPVPTSQVEFQRYLRSGRIGSVSVLDGPCGCDEVTGRCRVSRGVGAWLALLYASFDSFFSSFIAVGSSSAAWLTAVEADRTVVPEWRGVHATLLAVAMVAGAAAVVRVLAAFGAGAYLLRRHKLRLKLRGKQVPWHSTMSRRMGRLAIRQGSLLVAASSVLFLLTCNSWIWHSNVMINTGRADLFDKCDPLDATLCALPFPSSFFLEDDEATPTGRRVSFGPESLPYTRGWQHVPPASLNEFDGFSTLAPILFYLEGMSSAGLVGPEDVGMSLFPNSSITWLIEADTGHMVPHFTELDAMDPRSSLAVLQPATPLRHATRYVVAVCGAEGEWGELLQPTPGFRELVEAAGVDRLAKLRPKLRHRAERFSAEVFPVLREKLGMENDGDDPQQEEEKEKEEEEEGADPDVLGLGLGEIQLAWDFVTASEESQLGLLRGMQAASKSWLDIAVPSSVVSSKVPDTGDDGGLGGGRKRKRKLGSKRELLIAQASHNGSGGGGEIVGVERKMDDFRENGGYGEERSGRGWHIDERVPVRRRETLSDYNGERRRNLSSAASLTGSPLPYRVVKVEVDDSGGGISREGDDGEDVGRGGSPIARTVWARMPVPAFVSPSSRGSGLTAAAVDVAAVAATTTTADTTVTSRNAGDRLLSSASLTPTGGGEGRRGADDGRTTSYEDAPLPSATTTPATTMPMLEVGFVVRVPRCVASGERAPSMIVQYGHGLFGDRSEVLEPFLGELAERGAWVLVAADWRGMARNDLLVVLKALVSRPELLFSVIPENLMQGFVNQEAVLHLISRRLRDFLGDGAAPLAEGTEVPLGFYGISQGAILGAGYSQYSSLIRRTVLGSGGTPFSFLIPRSVDFLFYHRLLDLNLPRARDVRLLLSLLQMSWDRLEASAWLAPTPAAKASDAGRTSQASPAGGGKAVLMQGGTGDSEVSLIGTEILARAYAATAVPPAAVHVWNVPETEVSTGESCGESDAGDGEGGSSGVTALLALYDYRREASEIPDNDLPPSDNWVHMCVRHDEWAQQQVLHFMETGCVVNYCEGACERPYCRPS